MFQFKGRNCELITQCVWEKRFLANNINKLDKMDMHAILQLILEVLIMMIYKHSMSKKNLR